MARLIEPFVDPASAHASRFRSFAYAQPAKVRLRFTPLRMTHELAFGVNRLKKAETIFVVAAALLPTRGGTPLVVSSAIPWGIAPLSGAFDDKRVLRCADRDQSFVFGSHILFEKRLIENLSLWICAKTFNKDTQSFLKKALAMSP